MNPDTPITVGLVSTIAGVVTVLFIFWWRIDGRIKSAEKDLSDYRLEVAEKYASVAHLKDVEGRLAISIERLTNRIDALLAKLEERH